MTPRSKMRDAARAEFLKRMAAGEQFSLKSLAEELGASYSSLRNWKKLDQWDKAVKRKPGGQPGNKNSKGHKNAAGYHKGAAGNKNAEKDGAYSAVLFDTLTSDERELADTVPLESRPALEREMVILKIREHRILTKIQEYEAQDPEALYLTSTVTGDMTMENRDSAFVRVLKLQEALYKVQGRIATIANSLRTAEEYQERLAIERERLDIMRMRATGEWDVPEEETT